MCGKGLIIRASRERTNTAETVLRINGNEMPAVLVKEHYYRIRRDHIDYVRWTMRNNSKKVNNIRAYMLTALYNSVLTIGHYYQAEANYDVFGGGE